MKKIFLILAILSLSPLAFGQIRGRYVNSREGLNIRAEPKSGAARGAKND